MAITLDGTNGISAPNVYGRNFIINGAMQVWQRGTSQTTSGSYGADRFWMANAASASRSTDVPSGFAYSTKLTYSASDMSIGQPIELPATGGQGPFVSGAVVTLSYYAKVDSGTQAVATGIRFRDSKFLATNEVSFTPTVTGSENATWTTTWTRYSHSFTVPTASATNVLAGVEITGIGKDAYITGVQLEAGNIVTPFEVRPIAQEVALCQRYYIRTEPQYALKRVYNTLGFAAGMNVSADFPVTMRATPSISVYGDISDGSEITLGSAGTGVTTNSLVAFENINSGQFLDFHYYIADAEL